ncbi:polycystin-1-like protein 2 [Mytilus galloprovincialis]|uniref:polycystin-1-like protein 2 n=1 Tax=Mytilus galloprovincialis TaxID=29158 RepID=UPI003F7C046D
METEDPTLTYQFIYGGNFKIVVNASNQLSHITRSFNMSIYQTVLISTLSNNGPTNAFETITFTLQLSQPGTESCYKWDLGDKSPIVLYGEKNCEEIATSLNYKYMYWQPSSSLIHTHMYRKNSTYEVLLTGTNLISSKNISSMAIISGISCFYPDVHINGGGQDIDEPEVIQKSQRITLESSAEVNCKVSQTVSYLWNIYKISQGETYQDYIFENYKIDDSVELDNLNLVFIPRILPIGQYRINLNVSMTEIYGLSAEDFTYIKIIPTPLKVKISGGNARVVGYNQMLIVNAGEQSYDPDIDDPNNKTGMRFIWKCRQSIDIYQEKISQIDIPEWDIYVNMTRQDGCFGTGIGILPFHESQLKISTLYLEPNTENVFEVEVYKDDRMGSFEQLVYVVEGDPPTLIINCHVNCKSKMNPSGEFTLSVTCVECTNYDKEEYKWSLYLKNETLGGFYLVNNLDAVTEAGTSSQAIKIKQGSLIGGQVYRFRIDGKVYGYAPSFTEYEFITNLPPYGGTCDIDPISGYALETEFEIRCRGWLNPGEEAILGRGLLYRFWSRPQGSFDTQLLYYGKDAFTPKSKFSLGPVDNDFFHDVVVRISNPIGEFVETYLKVKVNEPMEDDVSDLLTLTSGESNELTTLLSSGKAQEAKQLVVAVASLINYSPVLIGVSRASLLQMITAPNTPPSTDGSTTNGWTNQTTTLLPGDTSIEPGSTIDPEEAERLRQEQAAEEKKLRTELRTSVIKTLSLETESPTLDSLQQTAMAFRVITHESSEISDESQGVAVDAIGKMADTFQLMVESEQTEAQGQKYSTAEDMIATLGSIVFAATGEEIMNIFKQNIMESSGIDTETIIEQSTQAERTQAETNNTTSSPTITAEKKKAKVKEIASKVLNVADTIYQSVIKNQATDEPPVVLQSPLLTVLAQRSSIAKINNSNVEAVGGSFKMPSSDSLLLNMENSTYVDVKVLSSQTNPYIWDATAKYINSAIVTMDIYGDQGQIINVTNLQEDIVIDISVDSSALNVQTFTLDVDNSDSLYFHSFSVRSNDSVLSILIESGEINRKLEVFVKFGDFPSVVDHDWNITIPHSVTETLEKSNIDMFEELSHRVFLSQEYVRQHGEGIYFIGLRGEVNITEEDVYEDYYEYTLEPEEPVFVNYTLSFVTSGCYYWSDIQDKWKTDNCSVSPLSNTNFTRCLCNHLTSFGVDFFVPPNEIDFKSVFNNLDQKLKDNWAVLATLCGFVFFYIVGVIWTRYQDKKDIIKWGVSPLMDNIVQDNYCYQITVCTGMRRGAGTRSHVNFILAGDLKDTGVRQLEDEKQIKTLSRGSINHYIMSVPEWLGPLTYIRMWHDNSGKGRNQGWYLNKIIITDLQTRETFFFLCNKWFAVEEDDGMVDRLIPVAGSQDLTSFHNVFMTKTRKNFSDSHLWISIFSRPQRSSFTRTQRLSCILSLVFTTMVANAMFYQAEEKVTNVESFKIGPLEFTLHGLYISVVCSFIVLPINILIDLIFRKSRPKETKITNAFMGNVKPVRTLSEIRLKPRHFKSDDMSLKEVSDFDIVPQEDSVHKHCLDDEINKSVTPESSSEHSQTVKRKEKFKLPHWCVYIGWLLVFISAGVSSFFTFLYSMEWGKEKSLNWLTSMILSIFESVTVIQPTKIIVIAVLIAALLRKPDIEDETDFDEDASNHPKPDEELIHSSPKREMRPSLHIEPPDPEEVAKAREIRLKEMKMHAALREIVFYFLFLALMILVANHNRDTRSFNVKDAIVQMLTVEQNLTKIHKPEHIWKWIKLELLPNLYVSKHWNGDPLGSLGERIVSTLQSYRVGPIRLRQERVRPESCNIPFVIHSVIGVCSLDWSTDVGDEQTYSKGWLPLPTGVTYDNIPNYPWKYRGLMDNEGIPYKGTFGTYPGGGYVADLIGKYDRVKQTVEELEKDHWIDRYSRGIFVEFTLYNPNVNMFSNIFISFEHSTSGKMIPEFFLKTFRLFSYIGGFGLFVVACEILTVIFIVYYLVREIRHIRRQGRQYFKSFWNVLELSNLLLAIVSVAMYTMRHAITTLALRSVTKLRDRFYNFQRLAMWDEVFGYLVAFTIFVCIIKLLHMFRFNRKMSMLAGVIKNSANELAAFSVALTVFMLGYAIWGYMMFGPKLASYRTMLDSLETLLAFALGSYDYRSLEEVNRVFGPMFFFAFFFSVMFLLINIFVAILNESIAAIKKDVSKQSNEYELVSFVWNRFIAWTGINFDRILQNMKLKYFLSDEDIKELGESVDNIEDKLDDIFVRLDNLAAACTKTEDSFGESSGLQPPVFSHLFPGSFKKPITFKQGNSLQHPVFKTEKWYAPDASKC